MSNNPFQAYSSEIVTRLIKMPKDDQRAWFKAIFDYVEARSGHKISAVYDYIVAPVVDAGDKATREMVLSGICSALRQGEITMLNTEDAAT